MSVLNLMLGKGRGGLEQAAVDYAEALQLARIPTLTVISPTAWVAATLASSNLPHQSLKSRGAWDWLAALRLRALARRSNTRVVLCHGNRALSIALKAFKGRIPVIAVAHNESIKRFHQADACFAITQHLVRQLQTAGARQVTLLPNMVRIGEANERPAFRTPPVIGSLGRLVPIKGIRTLIDALAILKQRGIAFHAIIGGDGEEREALQQLVLHYGLHNHVRFLGWVQQKRAFFESIDLFVLPSQREAFGLALVEAMSEAVPVIATDAPGPKEIIHHGTDGLLVPIGRPGALADAIAQLIHDPAQATRLGHAARIRVTQEYSLNAMTTRLQAALAPYIR